MAKKIVIVGGGGHAKTVISLLLRLPEFKIIGYVDLKDQGEILGIKYLGQDEALKKIKKQHPDSCAALGLGYVEISNQREKLKEKISAWGFHFPAIIAPTAVLNHHVSVGEGTVIYDGVVINADTIIGDYAIINTRSSVDHDCRIGNFVHIAPGVTLSGGVKVGDSSIVGVGSTVVQYKTIGTKCLIGAGAVVVDDCLKSGVYMGVPAKRK